MDKIKSRKFVLEEAAVWLGYTVCQ